MLNACKLYKVAHEDSFMFSVFSKNLTGLVTGFKLFLYLTTHQTFLLCPLCAGMSRDLLAHQDEAPGSHSQHQYHAMSDKDKIDH